jgi:hypothetical protein
MGRAGINSSGGRLHLGKVKEYVFLETGERMKGWMIMMQGV